jgi:hypothetical protein
MPEGLISSGSLVDVFDTNDESESLVVRSLLEASEIEALLTSDTGVEFHNAPLGHMRLMVLESDAEEAQQIIAQYREAGRQEIDTAGETAE